ncbi:MAG: hypothetical protein HQL77_04995 [Magnetococcales bacterium]|nr:hypothetical protein [Magnetococcales bacterium]
MKPYDQQPWRLLEALEGDEYATGDTWRKRVQFQDMTLLLVQKGAWCGVRQDVYLLENDAEKNDWQTCVP